MKMPHIDSYSFGRIVIDNKLYERDVLILADGKIVPRPMPKGTHVICFSEFQDILKEKEKPEIIVVGTGESGVAKFEQGAREKLEDKGIKLIIQETPEAVKFFNETPGKKVALFHLTC